MADMSTYLSDVTADYTTIELSVSPHSILVEQGKKNQIVYEFDDGSVQIATLSDSYFTVTLQWDWLDDTDKNTILDMYHSSTKAKGMENTFYWQHPRDGNTYTVRFLSVMNLQHDVRKPGAFVIPTVTLRVEGNKP